jgi:hypothetical protein
VPELRLEDNEGVMATQEGSARRLLVSLLLFGISFGFVEAAVVVYLRPHYAALQASYYPERREGDLFPLLRLDQLEAAGPMAKRLLAVELAREAATLVMLAAVGLGLGHNFRQSFAAFLVAFGIWDVGYYLFLKLLLDWPSTLLDWDLLFLLPVPWTGPVLAPVLVSVSMIGAGVLVLQREAEGKPIWPGAAAWSAIIAGGSMIIVSFCWDCRHLMGGGIPVDFNWPLFAAGQAFGLGGFFHALCSGSNSKPSAD